MKQMLKSTRYVLDFHTEEAISETSIARASDAFTYQNGKRPETLALHPSAYRDLMQKVDQRTYIDLKTFMGLKIYVDADLKEDEWRVRTQEERVDAVDYR